ncbi:WcaI family glycosyltransferase [Neorhodopirellula lusitana]|uniref:WcaI family glycosyltransferase n=1 Tax=Neorhodopirellula lusitana TaxID=445327 RepID=UPI003850EE2E
MKILLHGLNYAPEEIGIGKYSGEMVAALAEAGHEVVVVTTPPYYPQWAILPEFSGLAYRKERQVASGEQREPDTSTDTRDSSLATRGSVEVIRCPLWVPAKVSGLKRVVHLASFGLSSIPVVLWKALRFRPDVVMTVEPAAMCMPTTWIASRLCGAKCWLHVQDFEIDAAFELGILKQPLLKRLVLAAEAFLMRRFDRVSSISPNMLMKLVQKGVDEDRVVPFPNWVDCDAMQPLVWPGEAFGEPQADASTSDWQDATTSTAAQELSPALMERASGRSSAGQSDAGGETGLGQSGAGSGNRLASLLPARGIDEIAASAAWPSELEDTDSLSPREAMDALRALFEIPAGKCVALYAGNIGAKQGLELIVEAARRTGDDPRLHYVICGTGASFETLAQACDPLPNVQLLPVQPFDRFNALMNCADIHLLPQRAGAADLVMPSKLTGMLATGRPVVACASPGTQIADVVEGRGIVVMPDDAEAFADAIARLTADEGLRVRLAKAARQYAVDFLSQEAILKQFMLDLGEARSE